MVKIDIIAGFLGAGKTTWINKMLTEAFDEKVVIIENEFGETGIDGELLSGFDTHVKEITSGCICCTLYGDFVIAIRQMIKELHPARILIEPTGLGRPNEIVRACDEAVREGLAQINSVITIVDISMFPVFKEMGGMLYKEQIETAHLILLSHLEGDGNNQEDLLAIDELKELNSGAYVISDPWDKLSALEVLAIAEELTQPHDNHDNLSANQGAHDHDHHDHHHHDQDHHGHHHHDHHHDNDGFCAIARHPSKPVAQKELQSVFSSLSNGRYGKIFRAKYIVTTDDGKRVKGDYVYGKWQQVAYAGKGEDKLVFIGRDLSIPQEIFC